MKRIIIMVLMAGLVMALAWCTTRGASEAAVGPPYYALCSMTGAFVRDRGGGRGGGLWHRLRLRAEDRRGVICGALHLGIGLGAMLDALG
jgi:hypothetical protein